MRIRRLTALPGLALLATMATAGTAGTAAVTAGSVGAAGGAGPLVAGYRLVSSNQPPPTTAQCRKATGLPCYSPVQIEGAYQMGPLYAKGYTGRGRTIAIVDSFGSPTIGRDLATFDKAFGLPAPPALTVIQPAGSVPPYNPNNSMMVGWAVETTLDVEYAHTMAPGASILLVETPVAETIGTQGFPQIVRAENYVVDHNLGDVISQSFAASEISFPNKDAILDLRSAYQNAYRHHVSVLGGSGDWGEANPSNVAGTTYYDTRNVNWPASDPLVTAVGGTELHLNDAGQRVSPDTAWNDTYNKTVLKFLTGSTTPTPLATGGGSSTVFARPTYQDGVKATVGTARGVPDVSMSAACSSPVLVRVSFGGIPAGWYSVCGTSEATPLFAGVVAVADQYAHTRLGLLNPALYLLGQDHAPGIVDVTSGNNTVSFTQHGHTYKVVGNSAKPGYDLVTGVGTIDGAKFVPELASLG